MENYALGTLLFHSEVSRILGVAPFGYSEEKSTWSVGIISTNTVYTVDFYSLENTPVLEIYKEEYFKAIRKSVSMDTLFTLMGLAIHHGVEVEADDLDIDIYFDREE